MSEWDHLPYARHPARTIPYDELVAGLAERVASGLVYERRDGDHALYCYSQRATYERAWDAFTTLARGLIVDHSQRRVVGTPFPKFFNLGEHADPLPEFSFEVLEKLDGSLIVVWHDGAGWRCCTKGSFDSDQARAAREWLGNKTRGLMPGRTYLAEWVAPDNRIVVRYDRAELVLLAVYEENGAEMSYPLLVEVAAGLGWRLAQRYDFASLADLVAHAEALPATEEGFVLRFWDGTRVKIKGDEYRRIHALISRCTPLAMWEAMAAGDDLEMLRRQLPEEFWTDFDAITSALDARVSSLVAAVAREASAVAALSDKEVGLRLAEWPDPLRGFIFPYRKNAGDLLSGRTRQTLFRAVRPTGNELPGYTPSYAMRRIEEEST